MRRFLFAAAAVVGLTLLTAGPAQSQVIVSQPYPVYSYGYYPSYSPYTTYGYTMPSYSYYTAPYAYYSPGVSFSWYSAPRYSYYWGGYGRGWRGGRGWFRR